ncbi:MAG: TetR/AcrR family transcriptional regulator, partial [Candidatus Dormibacteria bacterium]
MEETAARQPVRRTGGRSARVRAAVIDATLTALLTRGLDDLSITEIAQQAGVHPTTIYRRWGSRSNLALDAVLSGTEAEILPPDTGSLRGDLLAVIRGIFPFLRTPLGELLVRLALRRDLPEYEAARAGYWAQRFRTGADLFERARARGELRADVDPVLALETLVGPMYVRMLMTGEPLDDALLVRCVDLVLDGIAAR